MYQDDEDAKKPEGGEEAVDQEPGSKARKKPRILRKRRPRLRVKGSAEWYVSDVYPNLIVVNWRKIMDTKTEMEKLQTAGQIIALTVHDSFCSFGELIWSPMTWLVEQLNGTANFREWLLKTKENEQLAQISGD